MTKAFVEEHRDIYGKLVREMSDRIPDSILQDTIAQFGGDLSEEQKEQLLAVYAQSGPDETSTTQVRGDHGLVLRFEKDRLIEITLSPEHEAATLQHRHVFRHPVADVLLQAELMNGAPGLYRDATALFETLSLTFDGFCIAGSQGVRELNERDDRFRSRTVGVFEKLAADTSGYRPFSWLRP